MKKTVRKSISAIAFAMLISTLSAPFLACSTSSDSDSDIVSDENSGAVSDGTKDGTKTTETKTNGSENEEWADDAPIEVPSSSASASKSNEAAEIEPSSEGLSAFVSLNVGDMSKATISSKTITNNVIINADSESAVVIESGKAKVSSTQYKQRLKLGGVGSKEKRSVTIYVGAGQSGTLKVDCASSSSGDATRALMANDTEIGKAPASAGTISQSVTAGDDGYISIYSANGGGINIYGIYWSQGNSSSAGGVEKICSSEATLPTLDNSTFAPSYKNGVKVGTRTRLSEIDTSRIEKVLFVSPGGKSSGDGTKSSPLDIRTAIEKVVPGGAIVLKGGTYKFSETVRIAYGNNGEESARKYILPESGKSCVFDFSSQEIADSARGVQLEGDYWHIYGITCYNAGDNGMYVTGNNNIVERCVFQANQDTGLQIARRSKDLSDKKDWPTNNLILNCTSFDNKDDKTGENADGFASKLTCGDGNVFDGCISYANCDDGWDLYAKPATGPIGIVTIKNCVAFQNGKTTSGANYANGDMNGFKLGGSNNECPTPHVVRNSVAFQNGKDGFTDNGNGGALDVSSCTSYANINSNFNFYRTLAGGVFGKLVSMTGSVTPAQMDKFGGKSGEVTKAATIEKSIYLIDKKKGTFSYVDALSEIHNGDKVGSAVSDPFKSELKSTTAPEVSLNVDAKCRNEDGTVNLAGFLEIKDSSSYASMGAKFGDEAETVIEISLSTL